MSVSRDPVNAEDLVQLSFVLPARLAMTVEELVLRLLAGATATESDWAPSPEMHSDVADAWDMPAWTDTSEDRRRMAWLVRDLDPKHVDVLSQIHIEPETPTNKLLDAAGYPPGTKASGVFRAITNRFRKVNRRPLWHGGEQSEDGQKLRSPGAFAEVVGMRLFAEAVTNLAGAGGPSSDGIDWDTVLAEIELTDQSRDLVRAFRHFPDHSATAGMLAGHLGYEGFGGANLAIGAFGRQLAERRQQVEAQYEPARRDDGSPMWWHVVATGEVGDDGLFWWTLRDDLDAALRRAGV